MIKHGDTKLIFLKTLSNGLASRQRICGRELLKLQCPHEKSSP